MKTELWLIIGLILLLAGCSGGAVTEVKTAEADRKAAVPAGENAEHKEESPVIAWEGTWVFLSDDVAGDLKIAKTKEDGIEFTLSGTRNNPVNLSSYANTLKGTGIVKGDKIEITDSQREECSGVLEAEGAILTVNLENDMCHTPQIYLNGEYVKAGTLEDQPLFSYEQGEFRLHGMSLGMHPSDIKALIGNPDYEGPDETGFSVWIQDYPMKNLQLSFNGEGLEADSIHFTENAAAWHAASGVSFTGERYKSEDGTHYLYNPDNGQLIFYPENEEDTVSITLTYADGNFRYGIESGQIIKE